MANITKTFKVCTPFDPDPVNSPLGIYSKGIILGVCKDLITKMLTATLFAKAVIEKNQIVNKRKLFF